jgi:antitoxin ParD1/3/4
MALSLKPQHERLIAEAMETGAYENPDEVITRALELLHSEDEWLHDQRDLIRDKVERAWEQSERGEILTAEESRADMEQKKAAWLSSQTHG